MPAVAVHMTQKKCLSCCHVPVPALQSRVRLGRVWREGSVHHFVEWMVHTVRGFGHTAVAVPDFASPCKLILSDAAQQWGPLTPMQLGG